MSENEASGAEKKIESKYENQDILLDRLEQILEALERVPNRFKSINKPEDFLDTPANREHLDSICMVLLAVGESFKQIDRQRESYSQNILLFPGERSWR